MVSAPADAVLSLLLQFLCALLAEVFIIKEAAVDFVLRHFRVWPEPHTAVEAKLNKVFEEQEYTEGGIPSLVVRQELAEARLFAGHEFFVCGQTKEAHLMRTLVAIGNGVLAPKGDNADYVVICDEALPEAHALRRFLTHPMPMPFMSIAVYFVSPLCIEFLFLLCLVSPQTGCALQSCPSSIEGLSASASSFIHEWFSRLASRNEDVVAATHGQKHASLVTPKFLYDCITRWALVRPSRRSGHIPFKNKQLTRKATVGPPQEPS
ncbi:hypothetical protein cyc_07085 [Cyclospora cayetanensis]|uniref:BRCT domain-containing protein n=1 Tax=Cyclospora cayetanensis TaxID=88456 RepID=A0A1D3DA50_9EIME|nr:hypothetical protein cyc_07085 [Cyclospora cayetanensis]